MSSLIASSSKKLPLRVSRTSVRYAGKQESSSVDPKKEIIRRVLYPGNIRNTSTPTGTWRPDVALALQRAIPSVQAHQTIERAWMLHLRHLRKTRDAELERKFESMKKAMQVLETVDKELFRQANRPEDPRARSDAEMQVLKTLKVSEKKALESRIRGLFPRELRPPTDTPSRAGWNYEFKPSNRPVV